MIITNKRVDFDTVGYKRKYTLKCFIIYSINRQETLYMKNIL